MFGDLFGEPPARDNDVLGHAVWLTPAPDLASAPVPEALTTILTMDGPDQE